MPAVAELLGSVGVAVESIGCVLWRRAGKLHQPAHRGAIAKGSRVARQAARSAVAVTRRCSWPGRGLTAGDGTSRRLDAHARRMFCSRIDVEVTRARTPRALRGVEPASRRAKHLLVIAVNATLDRPGLAVAGAASARARASRG